MYIKCNITILNADNLKASDAIRFPVCYLKPISSGVYRYEPNHENSYNIMVLHTEGDQFDIVIHLLGNIMRLVSEHNTIDIIWDLLHIMYKLDDDQLIINNNDLKKHQIQSLNEMLNIENNGTIKSYCFNKYKLKDGFQNDVNELWMTSVRNCGTFVRYIIWDELIFNNFKQSFGFLHNQPGTGKTRIITNLIKEHKLIYNELPPQYRPSCLHESKPSPFKKSTLVIVPRLTLVPQWREECQRLGLVVHEYHSKTCGTIQYTGQGDDPDVVLTTINSSSHLFNRFNFWRVVFDEYHLNLKKIVELIKYRIYYQHIWFLSGTPHYEHPREMSVLFDNIQGVCINETPMAELRQELYETLTWDVIYVEVKHDPVEDLNLPNYKHTKHDIIIENLYDYSSNLITLKEKVVHRMITNLQLKIEIQKILKNLNTFFQDEIHNTQVINYEMIPQEDDENECPICYQSFLKFGVCKQCKKEICMDCILVWGIQKSCPRCRHAELPIYNLYEYHQSDVDEKENNLETSGMIKFTYFQNLNLQGHIIIFTNSTSTKNFLKEKLTNATTNIQHYPEKSILILTYNNGSVGLNLKDTDHVVLFDLSHNKIQTKQSFHRSIRMNETSQRDLQIHHFAFKDTIEEAIVDTFLSKKSCSFMETTINYLKSIRV